MAPPQVLPEICSTIHGGENGGGYTNACFPSTRSTVTLPTSSTAGLQPTTHPHQFATESSSPSSNWARSQGASASKRPKQSGLQIGRSHGGKQGGERTSHPASSMPGTKPTSNACIWIRLRVRQICTNVVLNCVMHRNSSPA